MRVFHFRSKAHTLATLRPLLHYSTVLDLLYFPCEEWRNNKDGILERIQQHFGCQELAVRSSAFDEDAVESSMAGAYRSCLHVSSNIRIEIERAVNEVIGSYQDRMQDYVLVQPMAQDVQICGIASSHVIEDGSPYYVVSFDNSGQTRGVTAGLGGETTWLVRRWLREEEVFPESLRTIIRSVRELERIIGKVPIEIEFASNSKQEIILFQVRPISVRRNWSLTREIDTKRVLERLKRIVERRAGPDRTLSGKQTLFSMMADWNPAELIGPRPRPLAVSLFRELITRRVWHQARQIMGYRRLPDQDLLTVFGNQPFTDVRMSFNSLLPSDIDRETGSTLVDAWLNRLISHPELHDKVEFEVAQTCLDFDFKETYTNRYHNLLSPGSYRAFTESLRVLTGRCLASSTTLSVALGNVSLLEAKQLARGQRAIKSDIRYIFGLLEECKVLGTFPFAVLARHAFIAEALLRSLVHREAMTNERVSGFKRSLRTITSDMITDLKQVHEGTSSRESFMARFGHLRPGTFDIRAPRYADHGSFFPFTGEGPRADSSSDFILHEHERRAIGRLLGEMGLAFVHAEDVLSHARQAIAGREKAKFVFTRNLSDALESIVLWGSHHGLSRDSLSYLIIGDLASLVNMDIPRKIEELQNRLEKRRCRFYRFDKVKLGQLIRDPRDIYSIVLNSGAPNFIGSLRVEGEVCLLDEGSGEGDKLGGKIICTENADPGFDYIFAHQIFGLITCFGGPNSHMAVRCAEFGLPAAIGCGVQLFGQVKRASRVILDCSAKGIWPLYDA